MRGPYQRGTNNVGEFLAIVDALVYCHDRKLDLPIYSDSTIAIGWVTGGKCKTTLSPDRAPELHQLIVEAERWLKGRKHRNKIIKWPTRLWGEIPADYGRK